MKSRRLNTARRLVNEGDVVQMKTCPRCGALSQDNSAACCNCYSPLISGGGTARSGPKREVKRVERPAGANRKTSSGGGAGKLVVLFLIIGILAGGAYMGYSLFLRPTPEKALKQLIAAVEKQDLDGALTYLSSDSRNFLESTGLPGLMRQASQKAGNQAAGSKGDLNTKIESTQYSDPDHATVAVTSSMTIPANPMIPTMQQPQNKTFTVNVPMVREEGAWKLDGMKWADDGLKSLNGEQMKKFAEGMKLVEQLKPMLAAQAPGLNLTPVSNLIDTELKRRGIDPNSIKPLQVQIPFMTNPPR
jgi:hypothetical protein